MNGNKELVSKVEISIASWKELSNLIKNVGDKILNNNNVDEQVTEERRKVLRKVLETLFFRLCDFEDFNTEIKITLNQDQFQKYCKRLGFCLDHEESKRDNFKSICIKVVGTLNPLSSENFQKFEESISLITETVTELLSRANEIKHDIIPTQVASVIPQPNAQSIPQMFSFEIIVSWKDIIDLSTTTSERMSELFLENDGVAILSETLVFDEIGELLKIFLQFYEKHTEIVKSNASLIHAQLDEYFTNVSMLFKANAFLNIGLKSICNEIINSNSVSDVMIKKLRNLVPKISIFFNDLIIKANRLELSVALTTQVAPIIPQPNAQSIPQMFSFEIGDFEQTEQVHDAFYQYLEVAKFTNLTEKVFLHLSTEIKSLTKDAYSNGINPNRIEICSFASIVGPSLMGKTQFAFSLARVCPVIYVNFASEDGIQMVYKAFSDISSIFKQYLAKDVAILEQARVQLESNHISDSGRFIKLGTIGLLWEFVKYSTEFTKSDSESKSWFKFYLKARTVTFEEMSLFEYLENLKSLIANTQDCEFIPPTVFIDEFTSIVEPRIKLLRNICRILLLSTVLASTNAKVNNLLNLVSSSALDKNAVWVHAIRSLPRANLDAILNLLEWDKYNLNIADFNLSPLLKDLRITHDDNDELFRLKNLFCLMKEQSSTCLQGVSLKVFKGFKEKLFMQRQKKLDVTEIWEHLIHNLNLELEDRKPDAFKNHGPYHSLAMLSNNQVISDNTVSELDKSERPVPTPDIVLETINMHYYFFGDVNDPIVIPFKNANGSLKFQGHPFTNCSYFNLFKDDLFLCMALWSKIISNSKLTVASIACRYMITLPGADRNKAALRNNSSSQECMVYWAICDSTHNEVSSLRSCPDFLIKLVENVQIDNETFKMVPKVNADNRTFQPFYLTLDIVPKLKMFLNRIEIPFLIPSEIITPGIIKKLEGLCEFGSCNRLSNSEGLDIEFELKFDNSKQKRHGYIECKYQDKPLSDIEAKDYINKAKNRGSPFSLLVTFSLCEDLKTKNYFVKERTQPVRTKQIITNAKKVKSDFETGRTEQNDETAIFNEIEIFDETKQNENAVKTAGQIKKIDKMSIYSIFYKESQMEIVPLIEHENPERVFIIIETNFCLPKI